MRQDQAELGEERLYRTLEALKNLKKWSWPYEEEAAEALDFLARELGVSNYWSKK